MLRSSALGSFLCRRYIERGRPRLTGYLLYLWTAIFGVADFHSHIRWRAVKRVLSPCLKNLEVGAGNGLMSFQFVMTFKKPILVLTYTSDEYNEASSIIESIAFLKNYVILGMADAQNLKFLPDNHFEQVLLIDVLEHVKNDDKAVEEVYRILRPGGGLSSLFQHLTILTILPLNLTVK